METPTHAGATITLVTTSNRARIWLPLLQRLTEVSPDWVLLKHVDSALTGFGDIDSSAPRSQWPMLLAEFGRWASAHELGPVISCPHIPLLTHNIALAGAEPFFELDLMTRKVFLGSTLYEPRDIAPLAEMDPRGFRRLRPGAEGLHKLVNNGARRDGRPREAALRSKHIPELLASDPQGVRQAAALFFGPAERDVLALADAVVRGGWDRRAMLRVEAWSLLRALREPQSVAARARAHLAVRRCPVLKTIYGGGRRVPAPADAWLAEVARTHRVIDVRHATA
jgi:hypothetical protein